MASFQNPQYHEDTTPKHTITNEELNFLRQLQTELNTQDHMCQRDPRFWVIAGEKQIPTDLEHATSLIILNAATGEELARPNYESVKNWLNTYVNLELERQAKTRLLVDENLRITSTPDSNIKVNVEYLEMADITDMLNQLNLTTSFDIQYMTTEFHIYPNTLFLTHKDAEDHLHKYGYNYDPTAHAYAMTAERSPSVEMLWRILQQIDLTKLLQHTGQK